MSMEKPRESASAENDMYKKAYDVICKKLRCSAIDIVSLDDDENVFLYLRFKERDVSDRYAVTMQIDAAARLMRIHVPSRLLPSSMCNADELKKMSGYKKMVVKAVLEACSSAPVVLPDKSTVSDWRAMTFSGPAASVRTSAIEKGTTLEMLLMMADLEASF